MSRYIDADALTSELWFVEIKGECIDDIAEQIIRQCKQIVKDAPSIDIVICEECRKSHVDGKTTHHLWCTEWGRSTDPFGYCERGEREGE